MSLEMGISSNMRYLTILIFTRFYWVASGKPITGESNSNEYTRYIRRHKYLSRLCCMSWKMTNEVCDWFISQSNVIRNFAEIQKMETALHVNFVYSKKSRQLSTDFMDPSTQVSNSFLQE